MTIKWKLICSADPAFIRNGLSRQYEYIQLQQERINWSRSFTIEQQLRYGVTASGEPLDLTPLRQVGGGVWSILALRHTGLEK